MATESETRSVAEANGGESARGADPPAPQVCTDLDFMTMVSHELRHAAGVVSGFLDLVVVRGEVLDERQARQLLVRARENAHRLNRLLEDVTMAMHLGSGTFSYALGPIDLRRVVRQTTRSLSQTLERPIQLDQPAELPPVIADRDRQVQILTNLLSNATKYSPPGSPVRVVVENRHEEVAVSVCNEGSAGSPSDLEGVFEPFIRLEADHPTKREGLGLGLYITRLLVEGQGGEIDVDHDGRAGWTFTYTIPCASAAS